MYIIIVGGGRLGYYLSKGLLSEGHEVLVIEKDPMKVERIEEELGSICMEGDGCEASTLEEAGTERASLFVAVTNEDEDNLVSCQVARHMFNVPRVIARISNPKNETLFKTLGIDVTVSATNLILEHIGQEVPTRPLVHLLELKGNKLEIVEIRIAANAPSIGRQVRDLSLPAGTILSLVVRGQDIKALTADSTIEAGDRIVAVTNAAVEQVLLAELAG